METKKRKFLLGATALASALIAAHLPLDQAIARALHADEVRVDQADFVIVPATPGHQQTFDHKSHRSHQSHSSHASHYSSSSASPPPPPPPPSAADPVDDPPSHSSHGSHSSHSSHNSHSSHSSHYSGS